MLNLKGASQLAKVGGDMSISWNKKLQNLKGLDSLTTIGGDLSLNWNASLTSLDGMDSLTFVGGILDIWNNKKLTGLSHDIVIHYDSSEFVPALPNSKMLIDTVNHTISCIYDKQNPDQFSEYPFQFKVSGKNSIGNILNFQNPLEDTTIVIDSLPVIKLTASEMLYGVEEAREMEKVQEEEKTLTRIVITPNPADSKVIISTNPPKEIDLIMIFDQYGRKVITQKDNEIDVSFLTRGLYYVRVKIGKEMLVEKLIIE